MTSRLSTVPRTTVAPCDVGGPAIRSLHLNRFLLLFALPLLDIGTAGAAAVEETNYEIGYDSGDTRFDSGAGTDTNAYGVNGRITFPLATHVGAALVADYLHVNLSPEAVSSASSTSGKPPECALNTAQGAVALFVRDPAWGRIGFEYGKSRTKSRCDTEFAALVAADLTSTNTTGNAEIYLGDFTFGVTRTRTTADAIADINSSSVAATWYPTPNLRTALTADGLDARDTYHFQLEHQPEIFDNTTGLLIEYWTRREEPTTYYIGVGIRYYFNKRVELKTRDREYR